MTQSTRWKDIWAAKAREVIPDFDLDRGFSSRVEEIERLSEHELIDFIGPGRSEIILDAGCGTGVNISRLYSRVKKIIGIDFAPGSIERCQKRIAAQNIQNAEVLVGSIIQTSLPDHAVDKVICLSVMQYLDDHEVRLALREFSRILSPGGLVILHVKNRASLYWLTLLVAKRLKMLFRRSTNCYNVRPFKWYLHELSALGYKTEDFNGFNLLTLDKMPKWLTSFLQRFELRHYRHWLFQTALVRGHMADLKIRAKFNGGLEVGSVRDEMNNHCAIADASQLD